MEQERWRRIEELFQAVQERPAGERADFLKKACADDAELRREVESLLRAATDTRFLEPPSPGAPDPTTVSGSPAGPELLARLQQALGAGYRVERELGGGGMARIFVATDTTLGRQVVVKVLAPQLAAGVDAERFHREVRLAASLQHPHVVPLHAAGQAEGLLYYTMPFVAGESLRQRLDREGPLPVPEVVRLLKEVADALGFAHRRGIIHRDLKPANILLSEGHALVADFGIAKALVAATGTTTGDGSQTLTSTGLVLGTPAYMAPEQAASDQSADHRADLYALGCLGYELLGGRPPFDAPSVRAMLTAHLIEPPPPITTHRPDVPPALAGLIMDLLAKDPAQRPQTATDVIQSLDSAELSAPMGSAARFRAASLAGLLYVTVSAATFGIVRYLTDQIGLPDWVIPGSILLLAIGLPIILTTAAVQGRVWEGRRGSDSLVHARWFTWRRVLTGGVLAFTALGVTAAGYLSLRAMGIGPAGTLLAAGTVKKQSRMILADFDNHTRDSLLGTAATAAFRIDFSQSSVVSLLPPHQITEVLTRMKRSAPASLNSDLAREIALREGIEAMITGVVAAVGSGYLISAEVVSSDSGKVLAAYRERADNANEIIPAIDRLSRRLRERIGESLKSLRSEPPLERVSTASLAALRQYSRAVRAADYEGNEEKAVALLKQVVAMDSGFAMAYRSLGMYAANVGSLDLVVQAFSAAIKRLDRLTERERYFTLGDYYLIVALDLPKAAEAYEALLAQHPDERDALNNLALTYGASGKRQKAESLYQRTIVVDSLYMPAHYNLIMLQGQLKRWSAAESSYVRALRQLPGVGIVRAAGISIAEMRGDYASAQARAHELDKQFGADPNWRGLVRRELAGIAAVQGKVRDAERYLREAMVARVEASRPDDYINEAVLLGAVVAVLSRNPAGGFREVERALARYPLDSIRPMDRPYLSLVGISGLVGRADLARKLLTEYQRVVDPRYQDHATPEVARATGRIALAERRWKDAIVSLREAQSGQDPSPGGWAELGRAYDAAGEVDSAIAIYERYVASPGGLRPITDATELPRTYWRMGELYEQSGNVRKASDSYSNFVELWKDCDPELRPQVAEARRRLAELSKGG
jgi:serine/threonine-protein kinase